MVVSNLKSEVFSLDEELMRGAYGVVFHGKLKVDDSPVVIKKLLISGKNSVKITRHAQLFKQEVTLHAGLNHPNIVQYLFGHFEEDEPTHSYLVLEYIKDGDLWDFFQKNKVQTLPLSMMISIMRGITQALDYLHHTANILHRDIKPENILMQNINGEFYPKVCDFGFAIRCDGEYVEESQKRGTPNYMAPEIVECGRYSRKTDVFALGSLLYFLVTGGKLPFDFTTSIEIHGAILFSQERTLDCASPEIAAVINQCWQRDWNQRPSTIALLESKALKSNLFLNDNIKNKPSKRLSMYNRFFSHKVQDELQDHPQHIKNRPSLSACIVS